MVSKHSHWEIAVLQIRIVTGFHANANLTREQNETYATWTQPLGVSENGV